MDKRETIEKFEQRFKQLKDARASYETVWQDILDNCAPDLSGYIYDTTRDNAGNRRDTEIYDGTPVDCALKCAAGLYASISSPSRPWYNLQMDDLTMDEDSESRQWLDDVQELLYKIMHASNFYQSIYSVYLHQGTIGTSAMIIMPDYDNVVDCIPLNIGSYWLDVNEKGKVDSIYREFEMTVSQLIGKFGEDALPERLKEQGKKKKPSKKPYRVVHVIEPNKYNLGTFPKAYVSAYFLKEAHEGDFLSINGFNFFPVVAPRWYVNQGEIYGRMNPGRNALPDCKQLQRMVYDFYESVQKVNQPAMQGKADLLESKQLDLTPGAFNALSSAANADNMLKPLFATNPDIAAQWQAIADKKQQIQQRFYVDLFMAITMRQDKDMTAEEVRSLSSERMIGLSPGLENLNNELLNPCIEIIFGYAAESGIIPPPPEHLQGKKFEPEYVSVLAQAQKLADVNRITQVANLAVTLAASATDLTILDNIDFDKALSLANKAVAAPAGVLRSKQEIDQIRQQRQQMQQMQQQAMAMQQAAEIAKTAGEANLDGDNVLSRMAGVQGG